MGPITIKLPPLPPEALAELDRVLAMSPEQQLEQRCRSLNERILSEGRRREAPDFFGCYDCPRCRNKTLVYYPLDGDVAFRDCTCVAIRGSLLRAKGSGLADELSRCKFSSFEAATQWQIDAKARAAAYAKNPEGWLYLCGQVGGGKTHLCTAVVGQLIHRGMRAKYMRWKDDATELKALVNEPEYQCLIGRLLDAEVLYIDDFLKTERGENGRAGKPSTGDLNLAFQIINNRYCGRKITIISSEHTIDELISYDEAIGSRVYEMSRNSNAIIPQAIENNYRMKG